MSKQKVVVGNRQVARSRITNMVDSTSLFTTGQFKALYERLEDRGYIFIRGGVSLGTSNSARRALLEQMDRERVLDTSDGSVMDGRILKQKKKGKVVHGRGFTVDAMTGGIVGGPEDSKSTKAWMKVGNSEAVTAVYDGPELHALLDKIFRIGYREQCGLQGDVPNDDSDKYVLSLPHCTWLRIKGRNEITAEHADYSYFRESSNIFRAHMQLPAVELCSKASAVSSTTFYCTECRSKKRHKSEKCSLCHAKAPESEGVVLNEDEDEEEYTGEYHCDRCADQFFPYYTCWVSLSEADIKNSMVAMRPRSHALTGFNSPVGLGGLLPEGYRSFDKKAENRWDMVDHMSIGDVLIFNVKTVHAATRNSSELFRVSLDTRIIHKARLPTAEPMFGPVGEDRHAPPATNVTLDSGSSSEDEQPAKKKRKHN